MTLADHLPVTAARSRCFACHPSTVVRVMGPSLVEVVPAVVMPVMRLGTRAHAYAGLASIARGARVLVVARRAVGEDLGGALSR